MQSNPLQPNNVNAAGASKPVNGGGAAVTPLGGDQYLHSQNYGAAVDGRGNADCETGQRGYAAPTSVNLSPRTPGNQGTTFDGRARVPAGETFTRDPQTGTRLTP
jgi:hypothetical protein